MTVPDASSSRDFYQKVDGWNARPTETDDGEGNAAIFEIQIDDDTSAAEIRQIPGESDIIPPVWLIHLPVGDLTESLRRVSDGGGEVIRQHADKKYAVIRDPVGVYLALRSI